MQPIVLYGNRLNLPVTREFKQLVNITTAAGKFILLNPNYELIREAMRLELFEDAQLEDFVVHTWHYEVGEVISYDTEEVLFFYTLLDLSCRIFLCEIGDDLRQMAIESGETNAEEFNRVRSFFLKQAQEYLQQIGSCYSEQESFRALQQKFEQLNSIA